MTSKKPRMVSQEAKLEVALYLGKVVEEFAPTKQIQISWDESHYDTSTMVAAYDHQTKAAGFLPVQQMTPVYVHELSSESQSLCFEGRAQRVEGFSTMRAISHSLSSIGLPLEVFKLEKGLIVIPLGSHEKRVLSDGEYWIFEQNPLRGKSQGESPLLTSHCASQ